MISIVIPVYNEEKGIAATITRCEQMLAAMGEGEAEIIVVNDGSTDQTANVLATLKVKTISHLQNLGYGASLKDGIAAAINDTIVITDGDGTYPIESIPILLAEYRKGYNMVVGARNGHFYDGAWLKKLLRWFLKWLIQYTAGTKVKDINSGLRVFSRNEVMPHFLHLSNAFSFTTSVTLVYLLNRKYISYLPITYDGRIGKSKVRLVQDILRTLQYVIEIILYYNPIKIYLLLEIVLAIKVVVCILLYLILHWVSFKWLAVGLITIMPVVLCLGLLASQFKQITLEENRLRS